MFYFSTSSIDFDELLNVDVSHNESNNVVTLQVDYISKLPDNHWKHEILSFKSKMDSSQAVAWRKILSQAVSQTRGKLYNNQSGCQSN